MQLVKTEAGQKAFKERSTVFSARQRASFILFDGVKSVEQVLQATVGMGVTRLDIDFLQEQGFLAPDAVAELPQVVVLAPSIMTDQQRYALAKPLATKLTATLGLRGFLLNLAVESADGHAGLSALLPKIQDAVGKQECAELARILRG